MSTENKEQEEGNCIVPQQHQQTWYNNPAGGMYPMFNPYQMFPHGYGAQNYYQYYQQQSMQHFMNQQAAQHDGLYRGFTPGGQLMPFQPMDQQNIPQPNQQLPQPPTMPPGVNPTPVQQNSNNLLNRSSGNINSDNMPPLPPGPPPNRPGNNSMGPPTPNGYDSNAVIQSGPVKFSLNGPRNRMNMLENAFNQQPQQNAPGTGTSAKARKKRKKKLLQQQQQQARQQQQQQQQMQFQWGQNSQMQPMDITPPLPDAPPPPLPPCSPPIPPPPPTLPLECNENNLPTSNINLPPHPPPSAPTVNSYNSLMPSLPSASQVQAQGIKALDEWPASLRDYVGRCYAKCVTQIDKDRVGVILKGKLIRATNDGTLWTKDWSAEPLPLLDSDSKAVMNLKEKLSKSSIAVRLGPKAVSPRKRQSLPTRGSGRTAYRSGSSSSRSSRSSSSSRRSMSPRHTKKSGRNTNRKDRGHNNRRNDYSRSHFYSEFGAIGGSEDVAVKKEVLDRRAARFNTNPTAPTRPSTKSVVSSTNNNRKNHGKEQTGGRKKNSLSFVYDYGAQSPQPSTPNHGDYEASDLHIIGTCEDLEKSYLRLTAAPEASQVRPRSVLIKSLEMVKAKWIKDRDYRYAFEQLKSIRQDLTVQGIRDDLSVEVYETHARIALEMKDHAEFNQCQSQLRLLYNEVTDAAGNKLEFKSYAILFFILTKDFMELSKLLSSLEAEDKKDECIRHAVDLAHSWLIGSYVRIFKLYKTAPKMSSYLIDLFIDRERIAYFKVLMKAYRPTIPLDFIKSELQLDSDSDVEAFLTSVGNVSYVDSSRTLIDCKAYQG